MPINAVRATELAAANRARARGGIVVAAILAVTAVTATGLFAGAHVRLASEGAPGPLYECDAAVCAPAQRDDPARKNQGQMDFYVLPEGCVALAGATLRPVTTGIDVECGPDGARSRYRCEAGVCRPLDPAGEDDGAVTVPMALPAPCGGRIHDLIVFGVRLETPKIYVECDASSGPVREM